MRPDAAAEQKLALLYSELESWGRTSGDFGLEAWLRMDQLDPDAWARAADSWAGLGATRVLLYPMYRITSLDDQIETLRQFAAVMNR